MSRRWNVEQGQMFDVPTFEWLDAYEHKTTEFALALQLLPVAASAPAASESLNGEEMCYGRRT